MGLGYGLSVTDPGLTIIVVAIALTERLITTLLRLVKATTGRFRVQGSEGRQAWGQERNQAKGQGWINGNWSGKGRVRDRGGLGGELYLVDPSNPRI